MDCHLPGSSLHGICQAGILEWVAISFSRGSSWPRDQTRVSGIGRQFLYHWASRSKPRDNGGQKSLAGDSPWGRKESDTTWQLSNNHHSRTAAQLKPEISKCLYSGTPSICLWEISACTSVTRCIGRNWVFRSTSVDCSQLMGWINVMQWKLPILVVIN